MGASPARPASRIPEFLTVLQELWEANPELRFLQLVLNAQITSPHDPQADIAALYGRTDEESLQLLRGLAEKLAQKPYRIITPVSVTTGGSQEANGRPTA